MAASSGENETILISDSSDEEKPKGKNNWAKFTIFFR